MAEAQVHAANLEYTLKELQRKVREHEAELKQLSSAQHQAPQSPAGQAQVIKAALEHVTDAEPFLPFPGSVLPALLALRKTHQAIQESEAFLASQTEANEREKRRLEADRATLRDHKLLNEALNARVQALRTEVDSRTEMQPEDGTRERAEELERKKEDYNQETSNLMKALNRFIDGHLAAMLAAEELGGPVVGDMMDIDTEDLSVGFNAQGKPKKSKDKDKAMQDKGQRRIDEIWGATGSSSSTTTNTNQRAGQGQQTDSVAGTAAEMRQLTEELLNRLVEAKGSNAGSYVELARESAAARFLIRSKVAQFHAKDATRIRLVDFGRELEG